jgi:hypothetical protein
MKQEIRALLSELMIVKRIDTAIEKLSLLVELNEIDLIKEKKKRLLIKRH